MAKCHFTVGVDMPEGEYVLTGLMDEKRADFLFVLATHLHEGKRIKDAIETAVRVCKVGEQKPFAERGVRQGDGRLTVRAGEDDA